MNAATHKEAAHSPARRFSSRPGKPPRLGLVGLAAAMALAFGALFTACGEGNWHGPEQEPIPPPPMNLESNYATSVFVSNGDIYVAGSLSLSPPLGGAPAIQEAVIWKNGAISWRSGLNQNAYGNSIFVSGDDVYMAGYVSPIDGHDSAAVLWKNGAAQYLSAGYRCYANSVFVSGGDVYVAGWARVSDDLYDIRSAAVLWKNGAVQYLSDTVGPTSQGRAYSVYVSGGDVYVAGYYNERIPPLFGPAPDVAALWKNGVKQPLSQDSDKNYAATSVFVSGGDTYVAGIETSEGNTPQFPVLWKNGAKQILSDGNNYGRALSVFVSGEDIYVAGASYFVQNHQISNHTLLWKNGAKQDVSYYSGNSLATSVCVYNSDVYVAVSDMRSCILKNGSIEFLQEK